MTEAEVATTRFCARIVGPLLFIVGAVVLARFDDFTLIIPAILRDSPLAFITGVFTLIAGLALAAGHHHFGSLAATVITIIGVLTIIRGVSLMLAPDLIAGIATAALDSGALVIGAGAVAALVGAWLAFVGWFAKGPAQV